MFNLAAASAGSVELTLVSSVWIEALYLGGEKQELKHTAMYLGAQAVKSKYQV